MDMDSLNTLLTPHREALRSLCETEMWCRYRQHTNRNVPVVMRHRNLILIKYHIGAILRGLRASNLFPRLAGFIMYDDDDLDARPRFKVVNYPANEENNNITMEDESDLAMDELEHGLLLPLIGATYSLVPDDRYGTTINVELCNVEYVSDQEMAEVEIENQESDTETEEVSSTQNDDLIIEE